MKAHTSISRAAGTEGGRPVNRSHRGNRHSAVMIAAAIAALLGAAPATHAISIDWDTVVNNSFEAPDSDKLFNSYSGSSVNNDALVAFRGRTQGGQGGRVSGVFSRDMSDPTSVVQAVAVAGDMVPQPNNLDATFNEFPSLPRIDAGSEMIATRGQTKPVWEYQTGTDPDTREDITTRVGTTGIYATIDGTLITGEQKLGMVPAFPQFQVPLPAVSANQLPFEQFPGAPAAFDDQFIAFKGNYADADGTALTGVFYRDIVNNSGTEGAVAIAYRGMEMPNEPGIDFGSTAPPSAANGKIVFTGLDNEENPTAGGIYMGRVGTDRSLTTLVAIGATVPGADASVPGGATLNRLGEGLSFDGRYVSFWGAWGSDTRTVTLTCSAEGNADVRAACIAQSDKDSNGVPTGTTTREVPLHQGIFQFDTVTGELKLVAQTGPDYLDFLFWNFSGNAGQGGGVESEEEEGARWRSTAFIAADGPRVVFKATEPAVDGLDSLFGLYLDMSDLLNPFPLLTSAMYGDILDPTYATDLLITALAIERDSFRNGWLVVNASFAGEVGGEDLGWAGIYMARIVPEPSSAALFGLGLLALAGMSRRRRSSRTA